MPFLPLWLLQPPSQLLNDVRQGIRAWAGSLDARRALAGRTQLHACSTNWLHASPAAWSGRTA
jgi:hypothetical protein